MAAHSSVFAWRIPWTEEPGGLHSWGHTELDETEATQQAPQRAETKCLALKDLMIVIFPFSLIKNTRVTYYFFNFRLFSFSINPHDMGLPSQRRKWQHTPVFLPRESRGQRSLEGCCPQGHTESDTSEATQHACMRWRRKWQPTPVFLPPVDRGAWRAAVCGVTQSWT